MYIPDMLAGFDTPGRATEVVEPPGERMQRLRAERAEKERGELLTENRRLWQAVGMYRESNGILWAVVDADTYKTETDTATEIANEASQLLGDMVALMAPERNHPC